MKQETKVTKVYISHNGYKLQKLILVIMVTNYIIFQDIESSKVDQFYPLYRIYWIVLAETLTLFNFVFMTSP